MLKIYVACLASYNAGVLHGAWFDLEDYHDAEELYAAVKQEVLCSSPYPNVEVECPSCGGDGIHPYTSAVGGMTCSQCSGTGEAPASEEWAIHDHEGFPDGSVGEGTSFDKLYEIKAFMEEAEAAFGASAEEIVEHSTTASGSGTTPALNRFRTHTSGSTTRMKTSAKSVGSNTGRSTETPTFSLISTGTMCGKAICSTHTQSATATTSEAIGDD